MSKKRKELTEEELEAMSAQALEKLLGDKQAHFVREYMIDHNGTQAAIRAGYKAGKENRAAANTASKLLHDPAVNAYRSAMQKAAFRRLGVSLESICGELIEIKDRCMQKAPVMEWDSEAHCYKETGEWAFDAKGATKALSELANLLDVKQQGNKQTGKITVEGLPEEYKA